MKKNVLWLCVVLMMAVGMSSCSSDDRVMGTGQTSYVSKEFVKPNTTIPANYHTYLSPGYTSWVFFIDDVPFGNWSHPCRYAYVNVENGKYDVSDGTWPPTSLEKDFKLLVQPPV